MVNLEVHILNFYPSSNSTDMNGSSRCQKVECLKLDCNAKFINFAGKLAVSCQCPFYHRAMFKIQKCAKDLNMLEKGKRFVLDVVTFVLFY